MNRLRFEPLYYADRLDIINPAGDIGVVCLWSPVSTAKRRLTEISPDILDPVRSRVAVLSNLYGDGMYAMLCNLLYNPQIRHLIAIGQDLDLPTCAEIEALLDRGLEDTVMLGTKLKRIPGTERVFPSIPEFDEHRLRRSLTFRFVGGLSHPDLHADLLACLRDLPRDERATANDRLRVPMPVFDASEYAYLPSNVAAHQVVRRRPLDCWEELVVRGMRFGHPVEFTTGPRLELINVKTVITEPAPEPAHTLAEYGFRLARFQTYQAKILQPELPDGISYTYGNRLRGYNHRPPAVRPDMLATVIERLRDDPETRRAFVTLWDNSTDLPSKETGAPCLTSLFFRRVDGRLTLSATFRSHNLLTAWLENVYGLIAIQRHVANAAGMPVGPMTVVSQSLGIDPRDPRYALAQSIAANWTRDDDIDRDTGRPALREDPHGYFVVTVDKRDRCIVAEHRYGGLLIKRYTSNRAARIERQINGDMALSLVSHALWLGRELAEKEQILRAYIESSNDT